MPSLAIRTVVPASGGMSPLRIIASIRDLHGVTRSLAHLYRPELSEGENHLLAALALASEMGWDYTLSSGRYGSDYFHIRSGGAE